MTYYIVLEPYEVDAEDSQLCEFVMPVFRTIENARMLYPDCRLIPVEIVDVNPQDN